MYTVSTKSHTVLFFRRWSRKRFASFASMGRTIVIARVCNSIADASLRKSKRTIDGANAAHRFDHTSDGELDRDESLSSVNIIAQLELLKVLTGIGKEQPAQTYHYFIFYNPKGQSVVQSVPLVVLFLFYYNMIKQLKEKILNGYLPTQEEINQVALNTPSDELFEAAHEITDKMASKQFDMCSIINAQSGRCSENCKWCAQSAHYKTNIETYGLVPDEVAIEHAVYNERKGVGRFSLVTSGRLPSQRQADAICKQIRAIKQKSSIKLCVSLGLATEQQLRELKEAGVQRYHSNLETAPSKFPELCSTHTIDDKLTTLRNAQKVGLEVCCGGIIGMGESEAQRIELAFALRGLNVVSIPINILHPIEGTPLQNTPLIDDESILRAISFFRLTHPTAYLRLAGGRARLSNEMLLRTMYVGINSAIVGDLLTTIGSNIEEDKQRIIQAGYELQPQPTV